MATVRTFTPGSNWQGYKAEPQPYAFGSQVIFPGGPITAAGNIPTVTVGSGAGTSGTVTASSVNGYDMAFNFPLVVGTGPSNGTLATVTFGQQFPAAPACVMVTMGANSSTLSANAGAIALTKTGFTIQGGPLVASGTYTVNCWVVRSQ